jgi:NAD-dependent DNA ligase
MTRQWFYLDALQVPHGPVSDAELEQVLLRSDCFVYTEGIAGWKVASELFATDLVPPLQVPSEQSHLDGHGQPRNRRIGAARRADRAVHELLGLARGMIADGEVTRGEADALARWIEVNAEERDVWPINTIADRLRRVYADGEVDAGERAELLDLLSSVTGELPGTAVAMNRTTRLPLDEPQQPLRFGGLTYVFTGKFVFGTRGACQQAVEARGARCGGSVSQKTNVLVIGALGNADWIQSSHGRKIEQAVHYRASGVPLQIVSEEHWTACLRS